MPARERRKQLVEAAFRVVARDGVAAATTRRVAAEASVPAAVVHYCYRSTQELLADMLAVVFEESAAAAEAALRARRPGDDLRDTLRDSLHRLWATYQARPEQHLALFELISGALRDPDRAELIRRHRQRILGYAQRYLTDIADNAKLSWSRPLPAIAHTLLATIEGALFAWLIDRDDQAAADTLDGLADQITAHARPVMER